MAMINRTNICGKHGSILINLGSMFINEIIIKVMTEICMWRIEMWAQGTEVIKLWKSQKLLTQPSI